MKYEYGSCVEAESVAQRGGSELLSIRDEKDADMGRSDCVFVGDVVCLSGKAKVESGRRELRTTLPTRDWEEEVKDRPSDAVLGKVCERSAKELQGDTERIVRITVGSVLHLCGR